MSQDPSTVDELVMAQAALTPDATAVHDRRGLLRYGELDRKAAQMANALHIKGLTPGARVGTVLDLSCDLAVAMLAIWKAGGIYVPLDPHHPVSHIELVARAAGCDMLICESIRSEELRAAVRELIFVDAHSDWFATLPGTLPARACEAPVPAYLFHTSGSTGQPKGVLMAHAALIHKLTVAGTWGQVRRECRAAWISAPTFDPSLAQLLLPLAHGGSVVALSAHERMDPFKVWGTLRTHRVNVLDCTPSWLQAMLIVSPDGVSLDRVVMGGESLTPALARRVRASFPDAVLVNIYGPTETCIDATSHEISAADLRAPAIPIGKALSGYHVLVLDDRGRETTDDAAGELYIGGLGLAIGYWCNPQATAERFVVDPRVPGERLYRSGDIVRRRADSVLEFVRRADGQSKLRGQRVEPAEVEFALAATPGVESAVVKVWDGIDAFDRLMVGYVVLSPGADVVAVRKYLVDRAPSYMVPAVLVELPSLPLTVTGKVDRQALLRPSKLGCAIVAPRDELEAGLHAIWREVLQFDGFGIDDNFFELGGHSLAAVRVLALMRERLGADVLLAAFLARPTIGQLAMSVSRGDQIRGKVGCLPLRFGAAGLPLLFLVPPGSGVGLVYLGLARELAGIANCIALQALGLDRSPPGRSSMDDIVDRFVADIHRLQPSGPVRLLGYSAGGAIAQAMVRALHATDREVSHLVLIDPYCAEDSARAGKPVWEDPEQGFWAEACPDVLWDALSLRGPAAEPVLQAAKQLWADGLSMPGWEPDSPRAQALLDHLALQLPRSVDVKVLLLLLEGLANMWWAYVAQRMVPMDQFFGDALIVQPDRDDHAYRQTRLNCWRRLVPGLCQQVVRGEHATMLEHGETLQAVAAHLKSALACEVAA